MPKVVNVEEEKKAILDAFERCVLKSPMDKVTVRAIAKEAGISHSKIFLYFANRDEIVCAYAKIVANLYSDGYMQIANRIKEENLTRKEMYELMVGKFFDLDPNNIASLLYLQIYVLGAYDERVKVVVDEIYDQWRRAIRSMVQSVEPDITDERVRSLLILVEGVLVYRMNADLTKEDAMKMIEALFF